VTSNESPVRWGILATGGIARLFTTDLLRHGHTVTAVGSRSRAGAETFAREFGIAHPRGSYAALIDDPDVDVVYIATPHPWHAENAIAALEAGKHVLIEKPLALSAAQAAAIESAAKRNERFAMEAMWTRFLPHMTRIAAILAEGGLGRLTSVVADHVQDLPRSPEHRVSNRALGGGALLDLGVYPVSLSHQLLGRPRLISAAAVLNSEGTDTQVGTTMVHADGAVSSTFSSAVSRGATRAVIHGEAGRIEIDRIWYMPTTFRWFGADNLLREEFTAEVSGRGMHYQAQHVEQQLRAGRSESPVMPLSESVEIMESLDEIRRIIGVEYD
jgi:predicted dehydrogenase